MGAGGEATFRVFLKELGLFQEEVQDDTTREEAVANAGRVLKLFNERKWVKE